MNEVEVKAVVKETVREVLLELGIAHSSDQDKIEMQKDFQHLRSWRTASDAIRRRAVLTIITVLITGILSMVYVTLKGN